MVAGCISMVDPCIYDLPRVACWTVDAPKSDAKDDVVVAGVAV